MAESSEHAEYEFYYFGFWIKDSQAVKTTGGPVCAWDTVVFTPLPESRRKVWPLVITSSQK